MRRIQRLCLLILFYSIPFIVAFTSNTPRGGGGDAAAAAASVATGTARVAPLVDSALLRFVSAEKKKQQSIELHLDLATHRPCVRMHDATQNDFPVEFTHPNLR